MKQGFTLIELLISITLFIFIMTGSWFVAVLLGKKMGSDANEAQLRMQLSNALSDVRLHCVSASKIADDSLFPPGLNTSKSTFGFRGQKDVFNVTPSILTDDTWYLYTKDLSGNIVLREVTASEGTLNEEILVESKYAPGMSFTYKNGFEPNFLEVTFSGSVNKPGGAEQFFQKIGARFWFVGVLAI